jgi:biotin carboxyl carrier protein
MKYIVTINDKSYEVEVEKGEASVVRTSAAAPVPVVTPPAAAPAAAAVAAAPAPAAPAVTAVAGEKITAPMPGTILQVKKNAGEAVKKGEAILILEAMKMENEIIAPRDGVIAQIVTVKGAAVSTGDLLAVLQ